PEIVERPAEQVLAQVEEPGPERAAVELRLPAHERRKPFERSDEDGELEVDGGDSVRRRVHAGAGEHRLPVDELGGAGIAEPRSALGELRLELEQVAPERPLEPCERSLDALGGMTKRRLAPARRGRLRVAARPALEQPAKRDRRGLDGD